MRGSGEPPSHSPIAARASPLRIGVLISGQGTNLEALLTRCEQGTLDAEVRVVISNRPEAPGLVHSRGHGIPTFAFPRADYPDRGAQQQAMAECLTESDVELAVNAGFDQVLVPAFVARFAHRIINVHPSLLPAFSGGMHAVRDTLTHAVKVTGCTVHFVTDEVDSGPIILQEAIPVEEDDTEESLLARIHDVEHRLLPMAIELFAQGRLRVDGRRVRILPPR